MARKNPDSYSYNIFPYDANGKRRKRKRVTTDESLYHEYDAYLLLVESGIIDSSVQYSSLVISEETLGFAVFSADGQLVAEIEYAG